MYQIWTYIFKKGNSGLVQVLEWFVPPTSLNINLDWNQYRTFSLSCLHFYSPTHKFHLTIFLLNWYRLNPFRYVFDWKHWLGVHFAFIITNYSEGKKESQRVRFSSKSKSKSKIFIQFLLSDDFLSLNVKHLWWRL